ncbi:TrmO family methyltransferase domain-containing protein [Spirochaeta lutea]|uniref:TsaA-like domain-containing protein n=1 Tax=Spirochaeta lutea TaxID=1480694 RepID=A0A098QT20_9SPIO|nr:TrmO family methyltransferase [Spirochaeta lutea]KGE70819.1 hypothetical protein DC28_15155 [Spirochaeta lutea]
MDTTIQLIEIGQVKTGVDKTEIVLRPEYREGLIGLEGFSHVQVLWWANTLADESSRQTLEVSGLLKHRREPLGVFATRAPTRPNPVMSSTVGIVEIDQKAGRLVIGYIDAYHASPVLDIKPYYPMERVRRVSTPGWCSSWPEWQEDAPSFDWASVFNID